MGCVGVADASDIELIGQPTRALLAQVAARARMRNGDPISQSGRKFVAIIGRLLGQALRACRATDDGHLAGVNRISPLAAQRRISHRTRQHHHGWATGLHKKPQHRLLKWRVKSADHRATPTRLSQGPLALIKVDPVSLTGTDPSKSACDAGGR